MIPGLPEGTETSYCMSCRKPVYFGKYILMGSYEPDYDPDNDPVIWRHENGYHRNIGDGHSAAPGFPEIVTLCGSTKFRDQFEAEQRRLGLEGCIVLTVALFGHDVNRFCARCQEPKEHYFHQVVVPGETLKRHAFEPVFDFGTDDEPSEAKLMLDRLHFRKIDLSHRVHVINVDGYVGTSTGREILYAAERGKALSYLEPMDPGQLAAIFMRAKETMAVVQ